MLTSTPIFDAFFDACLAYRIRESVLCAILISGLRSLHIIAVHIAITVSWLGLGRRVCVADCRRLSKVEAYSCISFCTSSHLKLSRSSLEWRRRTEVHLLLHRVAISVCMSLPTLLMMCFFTTASSKQCDAIASLLPRATAFPIRFREGVRT